MGVFPVGEVRPATLEPTEHGVVGEVRDVLAGRAAVVAAVDKVDGHAMVSSGFLSEGELPSCLCLIHKREESILTKETETPALDILSLNRSAQSSLYLERKGSRIRESVPSP